MRQRFSVNRAGLHGTSTCVPSWISKITVSALRFIPNACSSRTDTRMPEDVGKDENDSSNAQDGENVDLLRSPETESKLKYKIA